MGRRRANTDLIYISDGFHGILLHYVIIFCIIAEFFGKYNGAKW
jgi:hypothetical protein